MEATIAYWGYIGAMEKKMETTIVCYGLRCRSRVEGFQGLQCKAALECRVWSVGFGAQG